MPEVLEDIKGSEHMEPLWGERFRSWYLTKQLLRTESMPLGYEDLTYRFKIFDYNYRFIMPPYVKFSGGMISYSEAERLLGVFRFPRREDGSFSAPVTVEQTQKEIMNLSEADIADLIRRKSVLTFEAFRIPQYGFEFPVLSSDDFKDVSRITDEEYEKTFKANYEAELGVRISNIKSKIGSLPDYLLILENTLDLKLEDPEKVSLMTSNILHI